MTAYCDSPGGCLCRCRGGKTREGCATGRHCGRHGSKCHVNCQPRRKPPGSKAVAS
jgi:hypothetical protein